MSEQVDGRLRPQYVNEVEQVIGVRFLPEPVDAWLAHNDPAALSPMALSAYARVYIAGLRLLAEARSQYDLPRDQPFSLTPDQLRETRAVHAEERERLIHHLSSVALVLGRRPKGVTTSFSLRQKLGVSEDLFADIVEEINPVLITFRGVHARRAGFLYFPQEEVSRIERALEDRTAQPGDVQVKLLKAELHTGDDTFAAVADDANVRIVWKRKGAGGIVAKYVSGADAEIVRKHYKQLENFDGLCSVAEVATAAGVKPSVVYGYIKWHKYVGVRRRRLDAHGAMRELDCISEEQARTIIQELRVIVPPEYLTLGEYAAMRGLHYVQVQRAVQAHSMPVHTYSVRSQSIKYLDGATIYRLDQVITKKPLIRSDQTTLGELARWTGYTPRGLRHFLEHEGVAGELVRLETGNTAIAYLNREWELALANLPAPSVPLRGTSITALANFHGISVPSMRERVQVACRRRDHEELTTHKYVTAAKGVGVYYLKADLAEIGIQVPATPAIPAGERPYGVYGPARAYAFSIQANNEPVAVKPPPAEVKDIIEVKQEDIELPKQMLVPRHLPEAPGAWQPAISELSAGNFISVTEKLTAIQIAERLGIKEKVVYEAISRIDMGSYEPEATKVNGKLVHAYTGKALVAIREQLLGISLRYLEVSHGLDSAQLERAHRFLSRNRYTNFSGRYSPGAIDFLLKNLSVLTTPEEIA